MNHTNPTKSLPTMTQKTEDWAARTPLRTNNDRQNTTQKTKGIIKDVFLKLEDVSQSSFISGLRPSMRDDWEKSSRFRKASLITYYCWCGKNVGYLDFVSLLTIDWLNLSNKMLSCRWFAFFVCSNYKFSAARITIDLSIFAKSDIVSRGLFEIL